MATGPSGVSVVCRDCYTVIAPAHLSDAVQSRIDADDGTWRLQYDHRDGECPHKREARANHAHPQTTTVGAKQR